MVGCRKPAISLKRARQDQGYYDRLIGSRVRVFDWHQNQWPWMTLNGRNALSQKRVVLPSPREKF